MAPTRKRVPKRPRSSQPDPLEAYRHVRKPMPPPERVIPDQRRKATDRQAEREMREAPEGER